MTNLNKVLFNRDGTEWNGKGTLDGWSKKEDSVTNFSTRPCGRCGGTGIYRWFVRAQPASGTCFGCNGAAIKPTKTRLFTAAKLAKLNEAATKKAIKRVKAEKAKEDARLAGLAKVKSAWLAADDHAKVVEAASALSGNDFAKKMLSALDLWGSLTEGQYRALETVVARAKEDATSEFVGTPKERRDFTVTIERIITLPDYGFGVSYLNVARDNNGNVILYKGGKAIGEKGEMVNLKATVKEHKVYNGINQTVVNRPKVL